MSVAEVTKKTAAVKVSDKETAAPPEVSLFSAMLFTLISLSLIPIQKLIQE